MNMNYSKELCDRIGQLRKQKGLTQEQLASRLGVTSQAVSKWENELSCPDVALLPVISDLFGISVDELFGRTPKTVDVRSGLIAEYLFHGDARDSSGNGHHGTVVGAVLCEDRFGRSERAYYFDGKDDYIVVERTPVLNPDAFTLSVWCYYDAAARLEGWHGAIVSQDGQLRRRVFQLCTWDDTIAFHRFLAEPDLSLDHPLQKGYWYHIAVTYEEHTFKLYRNGFFVQERRGELRPDAEEPLYIGGRSTDEPRFYFHGKIDDLRMYSRALSADEVSALFLEQGWVPVKELEAAAEAKDLPVLECVEDVQMVVARENLQAAAEWYIRCLGFKLVMEYNREMVMLSLYNGPNLIVHGGMAVGSDANAMAPFIFKTKRNVEVLRDELASAGADVRDIEDKGFAFFLHFRDPFGHPWTFIREKR